MILYYTGTGNSEYIAKRIAGELQDESLNLFDRLRDSDFGEIYSDSAFVIVSPTYAWQIPHILRDWLRKVSLTGSKEMYFVMNCGSEIGNAAKYLRKLCSEIGMNYKGCAEVVMPENYIAMFEAPDEAEAREIINKADSVIDRIAEQIVKQEAISDKPSGMADRIKSGVVNDIFYPVFVHAKKFRVSDSCVGCGKCVNACVMKNIRMEQQKPVWGEQCTHCMACICGCPVEAIGYGKASRGKVRYQCDKVIKEK